MATFVLASAGSVALAHVAAAVDVDACRARNVTRGTPMRHELQPVIVAANAGDTIVVKGTCVGVFRIGKNLSLVGRATPRRERARLVGTPRHTTLTVRGTTGSVDVTLVGLRITGGSGEAGGIENHATLALRRSVVEGNRHGGITNLGTLTLTERTSVRANAGSAIENRGTVTVNGSSSISGNRAMRHGGGILNIGLAATVVLNDQASVHANLAAEGGGGIYNAGGTVVMNDSSSVSENRTDGHGGGIMNLYADYYGTVILNNAATVRDNRADFDDVGGGRGGGIWNCAVLTGVDEDSVHDNFRGSRGARRDDVWTGACT
jgi:hypothetical protein